VIPHDLTTVRPRESGDPEQHVVVPKNWIPACAGTNGESVSQTDKGIQMTETKPTPAHPLDLNPHIRGWNNVLCLWRLCRKGKCFQTRACHADDARRCFHTHFVLLPHGLQEWMYMIRDAKREGLSYDEAIDDMIGTEAEGALEDWHAAVAQSEKLRKAGKVRWAEESWPYGSGV
jgi:hypothetical protein